MVVADEQCSNCPKQKAHGHTQGAGSDRPHFAFLCKISLGAPCSGRPTFTAWHGSSNASVSDSESGSRPSVLFDYASDALDAGD